MLAVWAASLEALMVWLGGGHQGPGVEHGLLLGFLSTRR